MSINIPVAICRVADSITVHIDTAKLGLPRFEGEIPRVLTMEMLPTEGEVK